MAVITNRETRRSSGCPIVWLLVREYMRIKHYLWLSLELLGVQVQLITIFAASLSAAAVAAHNGVMNLFLTITSLNYGVMLQRSARGATRQNNPGTHELSQHSLSRKQSWVLLLVSHLCWRDSNWATYSRLIQLSFR